MGSIGFHRIVRGPIIIFMKEPGIFFKIKFPYLSCIVFTILVATNRAILLRKHLRNLWVLPHYV